MKLTLMGPDDQGFWFLADTNGRDFKIVEKWEDHASAAELFGWMPSSDSLTIDERNQEALDFLVGRISDEITAPPHIAEYFAR